MDREQQVWESLSTVTDPELDESVTELGFVKAVSVDGDKVQVLFHLPTFWCAANFAYMMAADMRDAVQTLPWTDSVDVELLEHMYADTINRGIRASLSFQDTFGEEANGEIDAVRELFQKKAFQQRQELVLRLLLERGCSRAAIISMSISELSTLHPRDDTEQRQLQRYLEIRHKWAARSSGQAAFVTVEGGQLDVDGFDDYLQELRSTRINTQFNGEICRGLLHARYGDSLAGAGPAEIAMKFHPPSEFQSQQ